MMEAANSHDSVWSKNPNYDDTARFEYGRRFWRIPAMRERLLAHWLDERHPHRERFQEHRALFEEILTSQSSVEELNSLLIQRGTSLRAVAREIPSVFGSFFN